MSWASCVSFGFCLHEKQDMLHNVSLTKHLIFQAMNKGPTGPWCDEVDSVCVQFLFGGVISPLSARGELSRSEEVFGTFVSCTLSLDTDRGGGTCSGWSRGSGFALRLKKQTYSKSLTLRSDISFLSRVCSRKWGLTCSIEPWHTGRYWTSFTFEHCVSIKGPFTEKRGSKLKQSFLSWVSIM